MTSVRKEQPAPSSRSHCEKRPLEFKTYVVLQRSFVRDRHRPNVKIIAVKLTQAAAEAIVADTPGTWWERHRADKITR
jgi:hypothetical protein